MPNASIYKKRNGKRAVSLASRLRPNCSSANKKMATHKMNQMTVGLGRTQVTARAIDKFEDAWQAALLIRQ